MPLTLGMFGGKMVIKRIAGNTQMKKHLENLGFVVGGEISIISEIAGNIIVNVKESRIAVSREIAQRIHV